MPITDVGLLAGTAYKADKAMAMKAAQDQDCGWRLIDNVALDAVGGPVNWSEVAHQACRTTKDALARVEARREIIDEGMRGAGRHSGHGRKRIASAPCGTPKPEVHVQVLPLDRAANPIH